MSLLQFDVKCEECAGGCWLQRAAREVSFLFPVLPFCFHSGREIEGGIMVVGEEVDGIISIPQEDVQILNSSVTGTSLVRIRSVPTVVSLLCLCVFWNSTGYSHMRFCVSKEKRNVCDRVVSIH